MSISSSYTNRCTCITWSSSERLSTARRAQAFGLGGQARDFNFHAFPWLIHRLTYYRPHQDHIHMRGYNKQSSINTPLELTIRNQSDRFGLTNDTIDCIPRFRVTGSSAHEALLNRQVARKFHAYDFVMDSLDITNWQWPF